MNNFYFFHTTRNRTMGNALTKEIGSHRKKQVLDLQKRKLKELPPTIKKCKRLQVLDIHENELIDLPLVLGPFFSNSLFFSYFFSSLTPNIIFKLTDRLVALKKLDFSQNNVNQFPVNLPISIEELFAGKV